MKLTRRAACTRVLRGLAGASAAWLLPAGAEAAGRRSAEFRFTESYARRIVRVRAPDGAQVLEPVESGKFNLFARLPLTEVDPATFDAETSITLELEDTQFDVLLGDDPTYRPGRTFARITHTTTDENNAPVAYLTFVLRWTSNELTLRVKGQTGGLQEPILAGWYLDDFSWRFENASLAAATVEDSTFYFEVDYAGRVVTRTVRRGPAREEFDVSSVKLQAKGLPVGTDQLGRRAPRAVRRL